MNMDVPLKIVRQGGDVLEAYIKTQEALDKAKVRLAQVDGEVKTNMLKVTDLIHGYLPQPFEDEDDFHPRPSWVRGDEDYRCRKMMMKLHRSGDKFPQTILATQQVLSDVLEFTLERKALVAEIKKLEDKKDLINKGKYMSWLHD